MKSVDVKCLFKQPTENIVFPFALVVNINCGGARMMIVYILSTKKSQLIRDVVFTTKTQLFKYIEEIMKIPSSNWVLPYEGKPVTKSGLSRKLTSMRLVSFEDVSNGQAFTITPTNLFQKGDI